MSREQQLETLLREAIGERDGEVRDENPDHWTERTIEFLGLDTSPAIDPADVVAYINDRLMPDLHKEGSRPRDIAADACFLSRYAATGKTHDFARAAEHDDFVDWVEQRNQNR